MDTNGMNMDTSSPMSSMSAMSSPPDIKPDLNQLNVSTSNHVGGGYGPPPPPGSIPQPYHHANPIQVSHRCTTLVTGTSIIF